jgi:hypothetical protein
MPRVPRYGYIHYSAPTIANLGPGPDKKTLLETKIEAELRVNPMAMLRRAPMDFITKGRCVSRPRI